jgi:GH24 family phage-related lysozyme (muramidase)
VNTLRNRKAYQDGGEVDIILRPLLEEEEGKVNRVYEDSLGIPTGGIGHRLTEEERQRLNVGDELSDEQIQSWYEVDTRQALEAARKQANESGITNLNMIARLASVNYQLGTNWTSKFPLAYQAMVDRDYEEAKRQFRYNTEGTGPSKWYEQTPVRVNNLIRDIDLYLKENN